MVPPFAMWFPVTLGQATFRVSSKVSLYKDGERIFAFMRQLLPSIYNLGLNCELLIYCTAKLIALLPHFIK